MGGNKLLQFRSNILPQKSYTIDLNISQIAPSNNEITPYLFINDPAASNMFSFVIICLLIIVYNGCIIKFEPYVLIFECIGFVKYGANQ